MQGLCTVVVCIEKLFNYAFIKVSLIDFIFVFIRLSSKAQVRVKKTIQNNLVKNKGTVVTIDDWC